MILGDNIFFGNDLEKELNSARENALNGQATIFGYKVSDPGRFGVMEMDENNNVINIDEKPEFPRSNYAVTGLYYYPSGVSNMAMDVKPSKRNELEITSLNNMYLRNGLLKSYLLGDGYTWFDTGTFDYMIDAANMIRSIENNKGEVICSPEAIGYMNGWLSVDELYKRACLIHNDYGKYLMKLVKK